GTSRRAGAGEEAVFVAANLEGRVLVGGLRGAGGHRRGEPGPGALQPLLADGGQLLTTFPQVQRLLQSPPAALQAAPHLGELVTGLLVTECGGPIVPGRLRSALP